MYSNSTVVQEQSEVFDACMSSVRCLHVRLVSKGHAHAHAYALTVIEVVFKEERLQRCAINIPVDVLNLVSL